MLRKAFYCWVPFLLIYCCLTFESAKRVSYPYPVKETPSTLTIATPQALIHSPGKSFRKFYLLSIPEVTGYLVSNFSAQAIAFYNEAPNEEQAEIWLHRGLEHAEDRTLNRSEADFILIPCYLHVNSHLRKTFRIRSQDMDPRLYNNEPETRHPPLSNKRISKIVRQRVIEGEPSVPHVLLTPTWNPKVARRVGIPRIVENLKQVNVNLFSVGFERNSYWQRLSSRRIIPIPYVVKMSESQSNAIYESTVPNLVEDSVFYVGDSRPHATDWSGCDRSALLSPLQNVTNTFIRVLAPGDTRLDQAVYNEMLTTSDYCLVVCGDTPSSRSLSSAMASGCIPVRLGSRLLGKCESPCHAGWGWTITQNQSHLPFEKFIDWVKFPELAEDSFLKNPLESLALMREQFQSEKISLKKYIRTNQEAWIYGYGNPVTSSRFGAAPFWVWHSIATMV